ncbi:hypothetical protein DMA11_06690 [Marinilabiliaceae bacterium JC017]|nr:hypothetical protein DMA11_06690 [Marinilabiliaceae bacterium JC017]
MVYVRTDVQYYKENKLNCEIMKTRLEDMKSRHQGSHVGFGFFLILLGLVFLGGNLGMIPPHIYDVIMSWPMILVAIGVIHLFKKEVVKAFMFIIAGAFFLLPDLLPGYHHQDIYKYWPLLLILFGLSFVFRRRKYHEHFNPTTTDSKDVIDEMSVFGGGSTIVDSQNFKGGKLTCVFGGREINFGNARMSDSGAILDMVAVFGGAEISVPNDWNIKLEVVNIFGGFSDKRKQTYESVNSPKTLTIKGIAIFGGGEIKSA